MKYIHIVQFHLMSGGGVGSVITDLSEGMARMNEKVYVISLFRRSGIDFDEQIRWAEMRGVNIRLIQQKDISTWGVLRSLRKQIKELSKDENCCLFLHLKWGVLAGIIGSWGLKNVKRVEVYHSGYINYKLQAFICRPFLDRYIAVSKTAKQELVSWFNVNPQKVDVVYNGVDIEYVKNHALTVREDSALKFISVGRLSFQKGFGTSITAFAELKRTGKLADAEYTIIGDGELREDCEKASGGLVKFTGRIDRDKVYSNLASADVVVMPSLWEGNSILLLEVLAIGKALIVTDIPSAREVLNFSPLNDGELFRIEEFGAVFRMERVEACMAALQGVYARKEDIEQMGCSVGKLALSYSVENQVSAYINVAASVFK